MMSLYSEGDNAPDSSTIIYGDNKPIHLVLPSGLHQDAQCFILAKFTEATVGAKNRPFASIDARILLKDRKTDAFELNPSSE